MGRPRKNLYSAPCNPVAFSSDDEDDTDASNRATAAQSSYGSARDSEDEEIMGTANSGTARTIFKRQVMSIAVIRLAEVAEQLGKMVEQTDQSQPNPLSDQMTYPVDW